MIVQDQGLPEPTSRLSNFVPPKAIESANTEVEKVKNREPRGARSAPYLILTPAQRFQVGKKAAEHGITAWLCHKFVAWRKRSQCFTEYVF